ncbi:MAG: hypothetical protein P1U30_08985, partial [Phycisphaerales bacterium]|nr:hypothetical protein [Phycisphaerales bacterium]
MKHVTHAATIAALLVTLSANAGITLSDMYMSNSDGVVYRVDGATLQATEVFQFNNFTNWPIQIAYLGDGVIAGNRSHRIDTYDL